MSLVINTLFNHYLIKIVLQLQIKHWSQVKKFIELSRENKKRKQKSCETDINKQ